MKSFRMTTVTDFCAVLVCGLILVGLARPSTAAPIVFVDMDPGVAGIQSTRTVDFADSFTVDVFITGVEAAAPLNAFEFDLDFSSAVLSASGASSGGFLLPPFFNVQNIIGAGTVEYSDVTLLPAGAVGAGILASIDFDAIGAGTSVLDLNDVLLSTPFGLPIVDFTVTDGEITVRPAPTLTPEPAALTLFGIGLLGFGAARRLKTRGDR